MRRYCIRQGRSNSSRIGNRSGKYQVPALSRGLGRPNNKGIYILAYLIDNLVKINGRKQIVLPIVETTAKKQYKSRSIINYRVTNKFIDT